MRNFKAWKLFGAICLCIGLIGILSAGCSGTPETSAPDFTLPPASKTTTGTNNNNQNTTANNASVSVIPSTETVAPGDKFDVFIRVTTDISARSFECSLRWDPTKVQVNSIEEGNFFKGFAEENGIQSQLMPNKLAADNTLGKFPPKEDLQGTIQYNQAAFLMGGDPAADKTYPGPKGTGDIFILHMTANADASGDIEFKLLNVGLSDNSAPLKPLNPKINNGQIKISGTR